VEELKGGCRDITEAARGRFESSFRAAGMSASGSLGAPKGIAKWAARGRYKSSFKARVNYCELRSSQGNSRCCNKGAAKGVSEK